MEIEVNKHDYTLTPEERAKIVAVSQEELNRIKKLRPKTIEECQEIVQYLPLAQIDELDLEFWKPYFVQRKDKAWAKEVISRENFLRNKNQNDAVMLIFNVDEYNRNPKHKETMKISILMASYIPFIRNTIDLGNNENVVIPTGNSEFIQIILDVIQYCLKNSIEVRQSYHNDIMYNDGSLCNTDEEKQAYQKEKKEYDEYLEGYLKHENFLIDTYFKISGESDKLDDSFLFVRDFANFLDFIYEGDIYMLLPHLAIKSIQKNYTDLNTIEQLIINEKRFAEREIKEIQQRNAILKEFSDEEMKTKIESILDAIRTVDTEEEKQKIRNEFSWCFSK